MQVVNRELKELCNGLAVMSVWDTWKGSDGTGCWTAEPISSEIF